MPESNSFIRPDKFWHELGLRAEETVVHLGCGPGFYILPAAKIVGPKGKVIGVDIRQDMLTDVETKAKRQGVEKIITTIRANLENTPGSSLPDKTANWVLVANILHQSDPTKVLSEAKRVALPKGRIVIVEWNTVASPFGPSAQQRRHQDDMKIIAASSGLRLEKEFVPSPYHYGLVFSPAL